MNLANTWKMHYKDILLEGRRGTNLSTEFHHFANMNSKATTTPDTHQELVLPLPFSAALHAVINTLDHKVHLSHHFSMLPGSTWEQSGTTYMVLLGLGSIAQPIAFEAKQVIATTIPFCISNDHSNLEINFCHTKTMNPNIV